ncbi:uncharacterized protein BP01DRAFT_384339 [Aspergillus saccharolyticus JOP 1030-1]|uniref:Uncharacterized protein n=1 Tax=Aspergillus saccharolyticus JOP 1030-1 TaxID=1450539 RepID=A0A318Z8L7_9EURO|nr:hypothetical protein BP01DRAFT_384339 [Aspergillus saccharolyticus JOP 1030-1]PYH43685.1 hypothetical protein BP01DRAFT_384339 [Aspergillus saccharolyticus JOP 1030-1]
MSLTGSDCANVLMPISICPISSPGIDSMVHAGADPKVMAQTKLAVEKVLSKDGLGWDDVAEVFPCGDCLQIASQSRLVDTANVRTCFLCDGASVETVRSALVATLANHPILLSYVVIDMTHLDPRRPVPRLAPLIRNDLRDHQHAFWSIGTPETHISPHRIYTGGETLDFPAPSVVRLRQRYPHLSAPVLVKAAVILLILSRTNHSHALFVSMEAARSEYPFVDDDDGHRDAVDVAGPTFNWVCSLVAFCPEESILTFLTRVSSEQLAQTKHAHVPWHRVFEDLDLPRMSCSSASPTGSSSTGFQGSGRR